MIFGNKGKSRTNSKANAGNAIQLRRIDRLYESPVGPFKPEFDVVVTTGPLAINIAPKNGNEVAGLTSYKVRIVDGLPGGEATGTLDLLNPTATFAVADLDKLDTSLEWELQFTGAKQAEDDSFPINEHFSIYLSTGLIAAGGTIKVRLEPYIYLKDSIDNSASGVQDVFVEGGTPVVPATSSIADIKTALIAALDAANINYQASATTVVAGTAANSVKVTVVVADNQELSIVVTDQAGAPQTLVVQPV